MTGLDTLARPSAVADEEQVRRAAMVCWWTMPFFYTLFGLIFVPLSRMMPPPAPGATTDDAVAFFERNHTGIQIGFSILMVAIGLSAVTNGLMAHQMRKMTISPAFGYAFIGSMGVGALPGCLIPSMFWLVAVLRPDRNPELIHLLYDLCLLFYVGSLGCFSAAYLVLAIAILLDRNGVFPKWYSYVSIWQIVTELLAGPVFIFRDGPLAWDGTISFYMGTIIFAVWLVCEILFLRVAILRKPSVVAR